VTSLVLPDRKKAIVLLAEHLYDSLAGPKGQRFHAGKGTTAATHYEPCVRCGGHWLEGPRTKIRYGYRRGTGWVEDRFGRKQPCDSCGGYEDASGRPQAGAGRVGMDRMTGTKVGTEDNTTAARRTVSWTCNFCHGLGVKKGVRCEPCEGSGRREHTPFLLAGVASDDMPDVDIPALDRAIARRDESGSFHELDRCLAELARRSPHYWRTFHSVHVVKTRQDIDLDYRQRVWLQQAYAQLLNWMPKEIRVPRYLVYAESEKRKQRPHVRGNVDRKALGDRDAWMRSEFSTGRLTLQEIMRETGLSRSRVYEVVYGEAS
jgi:hypothetical protein